MFSGWSVMATGGATADCWVKVKFITYFVMLMKVVYWWAGIRVKLDCGVIV